MHRYGYWGGDAAGMWMIFHSAFWVLLAIALVAGVYVLSRDRSAPKDDEGPTALELLDRRYAKGEIDREDYLQRKKDILETQRPAAPPQE